MGVALTITLCVVGWFAGWWITMFLCGYTGILEEFASDPSMFFVWPCVVVGMLVLWMYIPLETLLSNGHHEKVIGGAFGWLSKGPMFHPFKFGKKIYNKRQEKEEEEKKDDRS